jgi:hypothetical protein
VNPLYTPPDGYYDQPFIWIYDASGLQDGQNALNQYVYIQAPLGDFILRRIAGIKGVVNPSGGQYQIKDKDGAYIEASPEYVTEDDDIMIIPELRYPETGFIGFDLYDVLRAYNA